MKDCEFHWEKNSNQFVKKKNFITFRQKEKIDCEKLKFQNIEQTLDS